MDDNTSTNFTYLHCRIHMVFSSPRHLMVAGSCIIIMEIVYKMDFSLPGFLLCCLILGFGMSLTSMDLQGICFLNCIYSWMFRYVDKWKFVPCLLYKFLKFCSLSLARSTASGWLLGQCNCSSPLHFSWMDRDIWSDFSGS